MLRTDERGAEREHRSREEQPSAGPAKPVVAGASASAQGAPEEEDAHDHEDHRSEQRCQDPGKGQIEKERKKAPPSAR